MAKKISKKRMPKVVMPTKHGIHGSMKGGIQGGMQGGLGAAHAAFTQMNNLKKKK